MQAQIDLPALTPAANVCRSVAALDLTLTRYRDALLAARLVPTNSPFALAAANRRIQRCWAGAVRQGATLAELRAVGRTVPTLSPASRTVRLTLEAY